jgi:hypothetical protein
MLAYEIRTFAPASCAFKKPMICSVECCFFFISRPPLNQFIGKSLNGLGYPGGAKVKSSELIEAGILARD